MFETRWRVSTASCIDRLGRPFSDSHHLVVASKREREHGLDSAADYLYEFYTTEQRWQAAAEAVLTRTVVLPSADGVNQRGSFILPWEPVARHSHKTPLYGPISLQEAWSEAKRLRTIREEIVKAGGLVRKPYRTALRGYPLPSAPQLQIVIKGGQHRVAIARAMGIQLVTVRLDRRFRRVGRRSLERWPCVASGLVGERHAAEIHAVFTDGVVAEEEGY